MTRCHRRRLLAVGLLLTAAAVVVGAWMLSAIDPASDPTPSAGKDSPAAATEVGDDDVALLHRRHELAPEALPAPPSTAKLAESEQSSPLTADEIVAADDAAVALTLAYTTRRWDESPAQRDARIAPLLTDHARAFLAAGSSGAAEIRDQQRRQETSRSQLAFSQPIAVALDQVTFLVVARVTVSNTSGSHVVDRAYTVTVVPVDGKWRVDDLAPAGP